MAVARRGFVSLDCADPVEPAERVALLSAAEMFEAAAPATLDALAGSLVAEQLPTGTVVVREGDEPDDIWVVATRTLDVASRGEGAEEVVVNWLRPGDYFGEIGLQRAVPRTATVVTSRDCDLWRVTGEDFLRIVNRAAGGSGGLRAGITTRLTRTHSSRAVEQPKT